MAETEASKRRPRRRRRWLKPLALSFLLFLAIVTAGFLDLRAYFMERILARGQGSPEALTSAMALLTDEASHNLLFTVARGERAALPHILRSFYTGELDFKQFTIGRYEPSRTGDLYAWLCVRPIMHMGDAAALGYLTTIVHVAQLPPNQRWKQHKVVEEQIDAMKRALNLGMAPVVMFVSHLARFAENYDSNQALLSCARVGVALESYRLIHHCWPESPSQLVPGLLATIPEDPFGTGPLHYRRLEDGVVVYSVGPDREDNGGVRARQSFKIPKTDRGFRLWDPERRGQPPAPKAQTDEGADTDG